MYDAITGAQPSSLIPSEGAPVDYKERLTNLETRVRAIAREAGIADPGSIQVRVDGCPFAMGAADTKEDGTRVVHVPIFWLMTAKELKALPKDWDQAAKTFGTIQQSLAGTGQMDSWNCKLGRESWGQWLSRSVGMGSGGEAFVSEGSWNRLHEFFTDISGDKINHEGIFDLIVGHELTHIAKDHKHAHSHNTGLKFWGAMSLLLTTIVVAVGLTALGIVRVPSVQHLKHLALTEALPIMSANLVAYPLLTLWTAKRQRAHEYEADLMAVNRGGDQAMEGAKQFISLVEKHFGHPSGIGRLLASHPDAKSRIAHLEKHRTKT